MERYSMFLGRKNQYCENDYNTKCNLQIRCYPIQITNDIFHKTRTKNFTIHMEIPKTLNSQNSLEKEECSWRNQPSWLQTILQSYSHQDSIVLAQKQKYRPLYWVDSEGHTGWNLDSTHPQNTNSYEAWKRTLYSERETFQAIFLPALINLATTLASQEDESCLILLSRAELFNKVGESAQTGYARPNYWQKHTVHHGNKQKSAAKM